VSAQHRYPPLPPIPAPARLFVYGTLMSGHLRAQAWPHRPASITPAWTRGELYDLGPYPALVSGSDRIRGEIWAFPPDSADWLATLATLDALEGHHGGPDDLYGRALVPCFPLAELRPASPTVAVDCYAYRYLGQTRAEQRIHADRTGFVRWMKMPDQEG
jgi:gamma-glutamylcyclotransferase (GGCT)/AIG2-like uncharacterized protein YtfP